MRSCLRGLLLLLPLAAGAGRLAAQVPDSLRADSLAVADTTDRTARFIESRRETETRLPVLPTVGTEALLPPLSRIVFNRDSIEWTNAETVSDLLARIPGVFLWRGGWIGRAEMPNVQGRGATSVEYSLDGLAFLPVGEDSLAVDPSLFALSLLERIEVERLPGLLRVHLHTKRHDRLAPRSRIGVASGDLDIARYQASLERRTPGGVGFILAADHLSVPSGSTAPGNYRNTAALIQLNYLPSPHQGFQLQWHRLGPKRELLRTDGTPSDTIAPGIDGRRSDLQARFHWRERTDGLGARVDVLAGRTGWADEQGDSLSRSLWQAGVIGGWRGERWQLDGTALWRSTWSPLDVRVRAGVAPGRYLSASAEGAWIAHDEGRSSRWITLRAGAELPAGLTASGVWRQGEVVASPAIVADSSQTLSDQSVHVGWQHPRVGVEVGYARTDAFAPLSYRQFLAVDRLGPVPAAEWLTVQGRLALRQWLVVEGWYSDPVGDPIEGLPPTHSVVTATIRSKFLRTFRSGIFDLKLQVGMETWGTGVIGRHGDGTPMALPGATFFRGLIQIGFDRFIMYFDQHNMANATAGYVPGYRIRGAARTFGVRWEFLN